MPQTEEQRLQDQIDRMFTSDGDGIPHVTAELLGGLLRQVHFLEKRLAVLEEKVLRGSLR